MSNNATSATLIIVEHMRNRELIAGTKLVKESVIIKIVRRYC